MSAGTKVSHSPLLLLTTASNECIEARESERATAATVRQADWPSTCTWHAAYPTKLLSLKKDASSSSSSSALIFRVSASFSLLSAKSLQSENDHEFCLSLFLTHLLLDSHTDGSFIIFRPREFTQTEQE